MLGLSNWISNLKRSLKQSSSPSTTSSVLPSWSPLTLGGNMGVGYLAAPHCHTVESTPPLRVRGGKNAEKAISSLREEPGGKEVIYLPLDLAPWPKSIQVIPYYVYEMIDEMRTTHHGEPYVPPFRPEKLARIRMGDGWMLYLILYSDLG
ncbi:hypothetical protein EDD18DRAFT_1105265 [Armillaria luteobubalina]|uniref:Uncharacterized protein n=1 Tax=Armillaria luteobubalina TaxID=153913 RepID=A0AA39TPQ1_9AGAR|nr:hypothetical protein EDD18DRAFT_1105265 [Armillaria luteobubalina]